MQNSCPKISDGTSRKQLLWDDPMEWGIRGGTYDVKSIGSGMRGRASAAFLAAFVYEFGDLLFTSIPPGTRKHVNSNGHLIATARRGSQGVKDGGPASSWALGWAGTRKGQL